MAQKDGKKIDHLTEDDPIPGQLFVCLSFVSPEGIRNCTTRGLKVRGVYPSYEAAKARCDELQQKDKDFDIFIGEVGKWLPWDPDINDDNKVKDAHYQEEELQKLMDSYKKNQERGKELEQKRKDDMIKKAARDEKSKAAKQKERMRKKLEKLKADKQLDEITQKQIEGVLPDEPSNKVGGKKPKEIAKEVEKSATMSATEEQLKQKDEIAKHEKDRLSENQKAITEQQNTVTSIDEQLAKIQSLYNKLNKKTAEAELSAKSSN